MLIYSCSGDYFVSKGYLKMNFSDTLSGSKKIKTGNCHLYVNGKKITLENTDIINLIDKNSSDPLSAEVLQLLKKMMDKEITKKNNTEENRDSKIEFKTKTNTIIDEKSKSVYGMIVGKSNRKQAYKLLESILPPKYNLDHFSAIVDLEKIGLSLQFNRYDILEEILIDENFIGTTSLGLKVGLSMEQAIEIHGEPRISSLVSAFWNDFSVFLKDQIITKIRIR